MGYHGVYGSSMVAWGSTVVLLQPRIDIVKYHGVEGSSIGTGFISTVTTIKVLSL